jgi:hypothetical protein
VPIILKFFKYRTAGNSFLRPMKEPNYYNFRKRKEKVHMCKALDDLIEDGRIGAEMKALLL